MECIGNAVRVCITKTIACHFLRIALEDQAITREVLKRNVFPIQLSQPRSDLNTWETWYQIVEEYSTRRLSYPRNKLPALPGLAKWLLNNNKDNYVAGLLKGDLLVGLSWRARLSREVDHKSSCIDIGPSWSWASTNNSVYFQALNSREKARYPDFPFGYRSGGKTMDIHDIHIEYSGYDPFGEVKYCSLKVNARFKTGIFGARRRSGALDAYNEDGTCNARLVFFPDHVDNELEDSEKRHKFQFLCLEGSYSGWYGLVVESCKDKQASACEFEPYQRIGLIVHEAEGGNFFHDAPWKLVELF